MNKHKAWSAVKMKDGYAADVKVFEGNDALAKCNAFLAKKSGWRRVNGTQMWNEPFGQIEED
jgi:hypothetical protein